MGLFDVFKDLPVIKGLTHIVTNIGRGISEEGLLGAVKVIGQGLSKDWVLGIAAMFIPGAQPLALASAGASVADMCGFLDLPSDKKAAHNQQQQVQNPGFGFT